ncbi:MAG: SRPBCC family protein [Actinomycetota bacterium]
MRVERSVSIARPPGDVFGYVSDIRNDPAWHTDVLEVSSSTDAVGVGTVFNVRVKPAMGVSEGTMTVSKLEPGRLIEFQGRMGKMAPTVTNIVESDGSGAKMTRRVELQPPGMMKIMTPMIKMMIGKGNSGFLSNLKKVLEAKA